MSMMIGEWIVGDVLILVLMEVSTYSVEVLLKSLHLLRNRIPRQGTTIAMKQLRFYYEKFLVVMEYAL